jgi:hypothetical protein
MTSRNVLPGFPSLNLSHSEFTNAIQFGKFRSSESIGSDVQHCNTIEFASTAVLEPHVSDIALLISNKQMIRTHTSRIIAMMCYHFVLDIISNTCSKAMCKFSLAIATAAHTITRCQSRTLPFPASVTVGFRHNGHLLPKSGNSHRLLCIHTVYDSTNCLTQQQKRTRRI